MKIEGWVDMAWDKPHLFSDREAYRFSGEGQNKHSEGWSVHVTWDSGRTAQLNNFTDRAEAEEWIKNKSAAWL